MKQFFPTEQDTEVPGSPKPVVYTLKTEAKLSFLLNLEAPKTAFSNTAKTIHISRFERTETSLHFISSVASDNRHQTFAAKIINMGQPAHLAAKASNVIQV